MPEFVRRDLKTGDQTHGDCSNESRTHVIMLWKIVSQCIFIDIVSVCMNCNMSISSGVHGLLDMLLANVFEVFALTLHLIGIFESALTERDFAI